MGQKRFTLLFLLCWLAATAARCQVNLDSLWAVWKHKALPDTARLKAMHDIIWKGYLFPNPDTALLLAGQELQLARKAGDRKWEAVAVRTQGVASYVGGNAQAAIAHYNAALKLFTAIGDTLNIAQVYVNLALVNDRQGNFKTALELNFKALKIREHMADSLGLAASLNNIANILRNQGEQAKALAYYRRALAIAQAINKHIDIADCWLNIGVVHAERGDMDSAFLYMEKARQLFADLKNDLAVATVLTNMGGLSRARQDYAAALDYYQQVLAIAEANHNSHTKCFLLTDIGMLNIEQKKYAAGVAYCQESLAMAEDLQDIKLTRNACSCIWTGYQLAGNYKEALQYYQRYRDLADSVNSVENQKAALQQQMTYEHEKEMLALEAEQEKKEALAQAERKQQRVVLYFVIGCLLLVVLFALFIWNRYRLTQRQKRIIEEQKMMVEEKQEEILASMRYAKRIQDALLPKEKYIEKELKRLMKKDS